jgi:hypothetical protein
MAHLLTNHDEKLINDTEVFRQVVDDKPSTCLVLGNVVSQHEN